MGYIRSIAPLENYHLFLEIDVYKRQDFDPLEDEPDVLLRYVGRGTPLGNPDLIIVPGSKNTIEDLAHIRKTGLADEICALSQKGVPVIGICGGYQILGKELHDPLHTESKISCLQGLGLLNVVTTFAQEKVTTQVEAKVCGTELMGKDVVGAMVAGYEIHMGISQLGEGVVPAFEIVRRLGESVNFYDGAVREDGLVWGTYIHGVFDEVSFRRALINSLRVKKGLAPLSEKASLSAWEQRQRDYDRLGETVRGSLDMEKLYALLGLCPGKSS